MQGTSQSFHFSNEEVEQMGLSQRLNTEGEDIDDNLSVFSERLVEKEGFTKNTDLILPEAEDDAFFDY